MRLMLRWMAVAVLCCAASAAAREQPQEARLREARQAYGEAIALYKAGKYAEAMARGEHALELREALLGSSHPKVANCLDLLGRLHEHQGSADRAELLLQRALAIREATLGQEHSTVVTSLNSLALLYQEQGLYSRAEPLFERALAIQEKALGKHHPAVATSLNSLASLYAAQGSYGRAEPLHVRALGIREAALGKHHPAVATSLNNLALLYQAQGLYDRARPLYQRALAIWEAAFGKQHPTVATSLNNLANLYQEQGLYGQAEPLHQRALALREAALGQRHPSVAASLNNLALLYQAQGLYGRAGPLHQRALDIWETALGKHHPTVATSLNNLALLYQAQGLYGQAEPLYVRALAIRETALGKHHPDVAQSLHNLASLYAAEGLYSRAEPLYQRALALWENTFGQYHPSLAQSLNNLANLYQEQGLSGDAEPLHQLALSIREAVLGKNHPDVAVSLNNLARLYHEQGLYTRAELLYVQSITLSEAALGKNHPDVAGSLNNLARLYQDQGSYTRAEPLFERALAIREAALGKNHPSVATSLISLALLRLAQHHLDEALPLFTRAFAISEQRLRHEALDFSEARLANFLQMLRIDEERLYALLREYPENARVRRLALAAALLLKGRSVEETAGISQAVYRSLGAQEHDTFQRLRELRTQLARLSLQGPGSLPLRAYQQRLKELAEQGDALEADLARRSAPLRTLAALPSPATIVDRVAEALPKDGALVEFIAYMDHPYEPTPSNPMSQPGGLAPTARSELRYLALVLLPDKTTRSVDLGFAEPINLAAARLRDALANRDAAYEGLAQDLYQRAFQPLLPLLGGAHRLFLSPDGQLALVPFAALHDRHQFLVETFDFTYLTSGKDLLPRPQEPVPADSVAVLADPDFSAPRSPTPLFLAETSAQATRSSVERFLPLSIENLAHRAWNPTPLPGTRQEAEAIRRLLPRAQLFLGSEATKERLLRLKTPGILHLATHGFFLEDVSAPTHSRAVAQFGALGEAPLAAHLPDPLLRSGLIFTGAGAAAPDASNSTQSPSGSALATALELSGLNLWGTQLVVLSACDTGRGDVRLGQGVYGLRRAFIVAGAETLVISLWKVNDETTRTLMEAYYTNLLAGQGRASALREAMRSLRAIKPEPHYWAPFIALGRDAPLRLLAPGSQQAPKP
jgi:CHAT domain-containing protein/lipopolysaccharide biosynthesis regulator YciM